MYNEQQLLIVFQKTPHDALSLIEQHAKEKVHWLFLATLHQRVNLKEFIAIFKLFLQAGYLKNSNFITIEKNSMSDNLKILSAICDLFSDEEIASAITNHEITWKQILALAIPLLKKLPTGPTVCNINPMFVNYIFLKQKEKLHSEGRETRLIICKEALENIATNTSKDIQFIFCFIENYEKFYQAANVNPPISAQTFYDIFIIAYRKFCQTNNPIFLTEILDKFPKLSNDFVKRFLNDPLNHRYIFGNNESDKQAIIQKCFAVVINDIAFPETKASIVEATPFSILCGLPNNIANPLLNIFTPNNEKFYVAAARLYLSQNATLDPNIVFHFLKQFINANKLIEARNIFDYKEQKKSSVPLNDFNMPCLVLSETIKLRGNSLLANEALASLISSYKNQELAALAPENLIKLIICFAESELSVNDSPLLRYIDTPEKATLLVDKILSHLQALQSSTKKNIENFAKTIDLLPLPITEQQKKDFHKKIILGILERAKSLTVSERDYRKRIEYLYFEALQDETEPFSESELRFYFGKNACVKKNWEAALIEAKSIFPLSSRPITKEKWYLDEYHWLSLHVLKNTDLNFESLKTIKKPQDYLSNILFIKNQYNTVLIKKNFAFSILVDLISNILTSINQTQKDLNLSDKECIRLMKECANRVASEYPTDIIKNRDSLFSQSLASSPRLFFMGHIFYAASKEDRTLHSLATSCWLHLTTSPVKTNSNDEEKLSTLVKPEARFLLIDSLLHLPLIFNIVNNCELKIENSIKSEIDLEQKIHAAIVAFEFIEIRDNKAHLAEIILLFNNATTEPNEESIPPLEIPLKNFERFHDHYCNQRKKPACLEKLFLLPGFIKTEDLEKLNTTAQSDLQKKLTPYSPTACSKLSTFFRELTEKENSRLREENEQLKQKMLELQKKLSQKEKRQPDESLSYFWQKKNSKEEVHQRHTIDKFGLEIPGKK